MIIFTEGRFGEAVKDILVERGLVSAAHSLVASRNHIKEIIKDADFVSVALWRLYERDLDLLDQVCFELNIPWSCAYLMENHLYCGPLIVPGHGPSFNCFRRRYATQHRAIERENSIIKGYANKPMEGPPGFIAPLALTAAGALVCDSRAGKEAAGRLRRVDFLGSELLDTWILPIHDNPRNGLQERGEKGERFVKYIVPELKEILS